MIFGLEGKTNFARLHRVSDFVANLALSLIRRAWWLAVALIVFAAFSGPYFFPM